MRHFYLIQRQRTKSLLSGNHFNFFFFFLFKRCVPTLAGSKQAGRVQPRGLEPLSARERAEGCTGNDHGPMEASQRPVLPVQLLEPSAEGDKGNARSVEHLERERERGGAQHEQATRETLLRGHGERKEVQKTLKHTRDLETNI